MEINKNNYEAYFLDFVEGNLSVALQKELDLFLIQNPELKAELQEFEMIVLDSEDVSNTSLKNSLFREETTGLVELDYLMVSEIEGSITKEEKMKLNSLMAESPSIQKDFIAYQKTKLVPSEKVEFPNKSSLIKKEGKVIYFFRYAAAVAAAILALVWFNINSPEERYNPRTAQKIILELEDDHAIQFAKIIVKEDPIDVVDSQNNNKIEELPMDEPINYAHNKILS